MINYLWKQKKWSYAIYVLMITVIIMMGCSKSPTKVIHLQNITIEPAELALMIGKTAQLTIIYIPGKATPQKITWYSNAPDTVLVSPEGIVTALAEGEAMITATSIDGSHQASCVVTVHAEEIPLLGLALEQTEITLNIGATQQLNVLYTPENATHKDVVWSSSDDDLVSVSIDGEIMALSVGVATVIVSTVDGTLSSECQITVQESMIFSIASTLDWNEAITTIQGNGNDKIYFLNIIDDISLDTFLGNPTFGSVSGITVTITGNHTIRTGNDLLIVGPYQSLVIEDLTLLGANSQVAYDIRLVQVLRDAVFTMQGKAMIKEGRGGVYVASRGTMNMVSGIIRDCTACYGGGVLVEGGTLNMLGGMICNNSNFNALNYESSGGGVYVFNGTFMMSGGIISENITNGRGGGGGVSIDNSTMIMTGGEIYRNMAPNYNGGGVFLRNSSFTMSGGVISENSGNGGGVYLAQSNFYFNKGKISRNNGEGVSCSDETSNITMSGGEISGNTGGMGAGLLFGSGLLIISGGIIYGNLDSGVSPDFANSSNSYGAALTVGTSATAQYGDGTNIFPHTDGHAFFTDYTVIGRE